MAYIKLFYHIVWRTKNSVPAIAEEHERDLYNYIWGIAKATNSYMYRINSMPDHIHMLVEINPTISLSDFVKKVKISSGNFMREHRDWYPLFDGWGKSYCALTYCNKERDTVINYISNQKTHHVGQSFDSELKMMLHEAGVEYDLKYFLSE
ncbi:MAG: IS200/IS605 family transposase [Bacteroidales bacterium]|nr:IS200/IS605 family transposase [Candidatus Sodaliphilus fimicaballi]